jgi:hypothetical protein
LLKNRSNPDLRSDFMVGGRFVASRYIDAKDVTLIRRKKLRLNGESKISGDSVVQRRWRRAMHGLADSLTGVRSMPGNDPKQIPK